MPKALIRKVQAEYEAKGVRPKKAASIAYATMNTHGFMHGSKETAKGVQAEAQYVRDHSRGGNPGGRTDSHIIPSHRHPYDGD